MDLMSAQLARLMMDARRAEGDERRVAHRVRADGRAERRRRLRPALGAWRRCRADGRAGSRGLALAAVAVAVAEAPQLDPYVEVAQILEAAAHRVSELGMTSEHTLLQALSIVTAPTAPGAAAALVDDTGTEISRLRAFGLVHAHVIEELGPREHAHLLELLGGRRGEANSSRVA